WFLILLAQLVACQAIPIGLTDNNNNANSWAKMYPSPYALEGQILEASHNAEWTELADDNYAFLREKANRILSEWGMNMKIDPSSDLYLGEYEYKSVPYSYKFYISKDNQFLLIAIYPEIKNKVEYFESGIKVFTIETHPTEIIMTNRDYKVLSISRGP
ncbi:MAG: hypothetical protein ACFFCW_48695, partial [Candidatus Hodarchaeota archaeon]